MHEELNRFYKLRAKMRAGFELSTADKHDFRRLGRAWMTHLRALGDRKGVESIQRDLKAADRPVKAKERTNILL